MAPDIRLNSKKGVDLSALPAGIEKDILGILCSRFPEAEYIWLWHIAGHYCVRVGRHWTPDDESWFQRMRDSGRGMAAVDDTIYSAAEKTLEKLYEFVARKSA